MKRKRMLLGAGVALMLVGWTTPASASPATRAAAGPEVSHEPVSFTISAESCSQLAAGTTLEGSGDLTDVVFEHTDGRGVTRKRVVEHAEGTATDQDGNTYGWTYDNTSRVTNTLDDSTLFRGWMVDDFTMTGDGPAAFATGFAGFHLNNFADVWELHPVSVYGDPIGFPSGPAHCDPI